MRLDEIRERADEPATISLFQCARRGQDIRYLLALVDWLESQEADDLRFELRTVFHRLVFTGPTGGHLAQMLVEESEYEHDLGEWRTPQMLQAADEAVSDG